MVVAASISETLVQPAKSAAELYFSELARDADLAELIELFVDELPERLASMQRAAGTQNWQEVRRLAHQLKGAGGSHGFPQLTAAAWQVERAARELGSAGEVSEAIVRLGAVCERVRAGVPVEA